MLWTYAVAVGVKVSVDVTLTVPGTRVSVTVVVVDGVEIDKHEQALETAAVGQAVGIQVGLDGCPPCLGLTQGFDGCASRFRIVPAGADAV